MSDIVERLERERDDYRAKWNLADHDHQESEAQLTAARADVERLERDETNALAERDAAEDAVQWLDTQTGGDGEYRYSTVEPDAPSTPRKMCEGIAERFSALQDELAAARAEGERYRKALEDARSTLDGLSYSEGLEPDEAILLSETYKRVDAVLTTGTGEKEEYDGA